MEECGRNGVTFVGEKYITKDKNKKQKNKNIKKENNIFNNNEEIEAEDNEYDNENNPNIIKERQKIV